ncbi:MAG TPA: tryptophan 2,3-dioxygenase family protein [Elainellaceae cyanobacterium]
MSMPDPYQAHPLPPDPTRDVSQNHYWSYHGLDHLLACKRPMTASQDEDLFITVHQICELAFHQMIIDLGRTLEAIALALTSSDSIINDTSEACYFFERVLRLYEVTVTTMPILKTMRAFAEFRTSIGPTSGFQSFQFRHLEIMSGVQKYWQGGTHDADGKPHIAETEFDRRYGAEIDTWLEQHRDHNLAAYYETLLSRIDGSSREEQVARLMANPHAAPLLRQMHTYDDLQNRFHRLHLALAVQQLKKVGAEMGTGGTSFRTYLAKYEAELSPLFADLATSLG